MAPKLVRPTILKCDNCLREVSEVVRLGDDSSPAIMDAPRFDICVDCTAFVLRMFGGRTTKEAKT